MIEEAVQKLLSASGGLSTLVGTKIYSQHSDQEEPLPVVSYFRVSTTGRELSHSGNMKVATTVMQVNCYANNPLDARKIADEVRKVFHGFKGNVLVQAASGPTPARYEKILLAQIVGEQDLSNLEDATYHIPVDVEIVYREV